MSRTRVPGAYSAVQGIQGPGRAGIGDGDATMTLDGNDRGGVKAPRTLFSLGRPGVKRPSEGSDTTATVDTADTGLDEPVDEMEIQYACGACAALLPSGAAFCGECGTPVAMDDEDAADGILDELVATDDDIAIPGQEGSAADTAILGGVAAELSETSTEGPDVVPDTEVLELQEAEQSADRAPEQHLDLSQDQQGQTPPAFDPNVTTQIVPPTEAFPGESPTILPEAPTEPAAVLYADPTLAEPLPPPAAGTWVSDPMVGSTQGDTVAESPPEGDEADSSEGISPAGAAAAGGAVGLVAGMGTETAGAAELAGSSTTVPPLATPPTEGSSVEAPTSWTIAPESPVRGEEAVPPGLVGTTAQAMPYGAGPVESSQGSNKGVLIAVAVVGGLLLLGGIVFLLTRGGGSDVATQQPSTTLSAARRDPGAASQGSSTTRPSTESSTTATTASSESTASTEASTPDSTDSSSATTATTTGSTATTSRPPPTTSGPAPTTIIDPPSGPPPAQVNFAGPPSFRLGKGGSASFTVANAGGSAGDFQCSGNGVQVSPPNGSLNPGASQSVTIQDFRNAGAQYSISCVGAGGSRYGATVVVDN